MSNDLEEQVKKVADEKGIHFSVFWRKLLMERFLARLARSPHSDKHLSSREASCFLVS